MCENYVLTVLKQNVMYYVATVYFCSLVSYWRKKGMAMEQKFQSSEFSVKNLNRMHTGKNINMNYHIILKGNNPPVLNDIQPCTSYTLRNCILKVDWDVRNPKNNHERWMGFINIRIFHSTEHQIVVYK